MEIVSTLGGSDYGDGMFAAAPAEAAAAVLQALCAAAPELDCV